MARNITLLLLRSVENLGIVGDIVKVKPGYARNYLLPMGYAEFPTNSRIEALKEERARAEAEMSALRSRREELLGRLEGVAITIQRSCNDQGVLYGSITQRDIADALQAEGYGVDTRSVRLRQSLRRVGEYPVPIQFDKDLRTEVAITVAPDRSLEDERVEMEFDDEGNLIEPTPKPAKTERPDEPKAGGEEAAAETAEAPAG
jgi:large subunit ribosomal protein L9